jgi:hypothetical protein
MDEAEQEITLKNTKAEIFDALHRALERAKLAEKRKLEPEKQEKKQEDKRVVESAERAVGQNVFSKELNDQFKDLQAAIVVEENRLQELYGIGREVQKLALVIEAGRERIAEIDAEKLENEEAVTRNLEKLNSEFAQKKASLQTEHDTILEKLKVERARENEEYKYNLERTRERENNAWADEKTARESELQKREASTAELLADAESKVEYIKSLEEKAEGIPRLIAAEKESATTATMERLTREYAHQSALAEMERKNIVARLEDKITYLEKELDNSSKAVGTLQSKLDKAYTEIRDLATKTVESTGGLKIIGSPEKNSG